MERLILDAASEGGGTVTSGVGSKAFCPPPTSRRARPTRPTFSPPQSASPRSGAAGGPMGMDIRWDTDKPTFPFAGQALNRMGTWRQAPSRRKEASADGR